MTIVHHQLTICMDENEQERAPLFGKWSYWYVLVIGFLLLLIVFFYFLTKYFA